jgi:hypothetical protein
MGTYIHEDEVGGLNEWNEKCISYSGFKHAKEVTEETNLHMRV